jgi:hypothetical protein
MPDKPKYAVILVYSTSHAIRIDEALKKEGIETKLIPVPRHLSSDCGTAVRIPAAEKTECRELMAIVGAEYDCIIDLDR